MKHRLAVVVLAAALAVGGTATSAHAQAQPGADRPRGAGMGNPARMDEMLFASITLSADQQAKIKAVHEQFQPKLTAMREEMRAAMQGGAPNPELRQKMQALNEEQTKALRAVLTAEQQKTFDANVARMPQGRGRGGPPPAGHR